MSEAMYLCIRSQGGSKEEERVERERGEWEKRLKDEERDMERKKGETELLVYKLEDAEGRKEMAERREEEVRREIGELVEKVRSEKTDEVVVESSTMRLITDPLQPPPPLVAGFGIGS